MTHPKERRGYSIFISRKRPAYLISKMPSVYLAFDLYGTLLNTASVSKSLSEHLPRSADAETISAAWRTYQLEYTWRLNSMAVYESFDMVTQKSLKHAVKEAGYDLNDDAIEDVLGSYDKLSVFEDVPEALEKLKAMPNVSTLVFSNGTEKMVGSSIRNSPELKHFTDLPQPFVLAGDVENYKPSQAVYRHLAKNLGKEKNLDQIWLISGNAFDIVGARHAGLNAIWVDRKGKGWLDQLGEPTKIVNSLRDIADAIGRT